MDIWGASCLGGKGDYHKALPKSNEWGRAAASFFATMKLDFGFQVPIVSILPFEHVHFSTSAEVAQHFTAGMAEWMCNNNGQCPMLTRAAFVVKCWLSGRQRLQPV